MMNACVVGKHQATHFIGSFHIRAFFTESYLNRGWSPVYEIRQFFFSDSLKRLVDLGGVNLTLDNVKDGHVLSSFCWSTHHNVIWVQQPPHHIQDGSFLDVGGLFFDSQRSVSRHQKVASRGGNQGG